MLALWSTPALTRAELSAPDNVLYGTITLGGQPVTTNQPTVVVEARRTITGQAVATGGVGAGNLYILRIPIEAMAPLTDARASLAGDTLFIVVRDATGVRDQTTYQIPEPGQVARIDFGGSSIDSDGDGLPDAWELAMLGGLGFNGIADSDKDGASNLSEFLAGTHPANSNDVFRVAVTLGSADARVSFLARQASGTGYEGQVRRYSLESTTNISLAPWVPVGGFTNIAGANQTVTYTIPPTAEPTRIYRGRATLNNQ
jgi:hypothetical protein